jgi:hypothetical protein
MTAIPMAEEKREKTNYSVQWQKESGKRVRVRPVLCVNVQGLVGVDFWVWGWSAGEGISDSLLPQSSS